MTRKNILTLKTSGYCLRALLLMTFILTFLAHPALAQTPQTLELSPSVIPLSLDPGSSITRTITLTNRSNLALPVQVNIDSLMPAADEQTDSAIRQATANLADWITVTPTDALLPPSAGIPFTVTITVPETVAIGGYGALIAFSPLVRSDTLASSPSSIIPRIGAIILSNIGIPDDAPAETRARIRKFSVKPTIDGSSPVTISFGVANTSLHYFTAKPMLTLKPVFGFSPPVEPAMSEKTVFPGKIRSWEEQLVLPYGIYRADLTVSLGAGQSISDSRLLIELPFTGIGAILAFAFGLTLILKNVKKITKAIRIIMKG